MQNNVLRFSLFVQTNEGIVAATATASTTITTATSDVEITTATAPAAATNTTTTTTTTTKFVNAAHVNIETVSKYVGFIL